jgi:hypothetical protein
MIKKHFSDWAVETAKDLRLDLYEPRGLAYETPWRESSTGPVVTQQSIPIEGSRQTHLITALKEVLDANLHLVVADEAGAGKTIASLRIEHLLSDQESCKQIFSDGAQRLVVQWTSSTIPNPGIPNPTLLQVLLADPALEQWVPDVSDRQKLIEYASLHRRLIVIFDGYDELTDNPQAYNRREFVEALYRNGENSKLHPLWIFTGRTYAINEATTFGRLFDEKKFRRVTLQAFDEEMQDRYMAAAVPGVRWRESLEDLEQGWSDLVGFPYTLREIARAFDESKPKVPNWTSPSDLFCQISHRMLLREIEKPNCQSGLRAAQIEDPTDGLQLAERALGAVAFELALQGIWRELRANSPMEQKKMVRQVIEQAKLRFCESLARDNFDKSCFEKYWNWVYDFVSQFILHNGATQAYISTQTIGFTSLKIHEMWAARYLSAYSTEFDLRRPDETRQCFLDCIGRDDWANMIRCMIRMPMDSDRKRYGARKALYLEALKVLFERPTEIDQRRPTVLMWEAQKWLWKNTGLSGLVSDLHSHLVNQFQSIKRRPEYSVAVRELLDPRRYVLLYCRDTCALERRYLPRILTWLFRQLGWISKSGDTGLFEMGPDKSHFRHKQVKVTLTQRFGICKYQLTEEQFSIWDNLPSKGESNLPAMAISWLDCYFMLVGLSGERVKLSDGRVYQFTFPTEAQWEYAYRAGSATEYCFGDDAEKMYKYAWYFDNSDVREHPVGGKKANGWGLHDMHGNVWEWCWDWYGEYPDESITDPLGPDEGSYRVYRHGRWLSGAADCRSAIRRRFGPSLRRNNLGFRVALSSIGIPKSP